MVEYVGIEAQLVWELLFSGEDGLLKEPDATDYSGALEGMEAAELFSLVREAGRRVRRLTDSEENSFSENLSVLNSTLDRILPLSPLKVHWEN